MRRVVQVPLTDHGDNREFMHRGDPNGVNRHSLLTRDVHPRDQQAKGCATGVDREPDRHADLHPDLGVNAPDLLPTEIQGLMEVLIREFRFPIDPGRRIADVKMFAAHLIEIGLIE